MLVALVVLGIAAGALTSLAGQGGGLLLLLACGSLVGPHAALAITAPALLVGNLHRAWLYRRAVDRAVAVRMTVGTLPGALAGGLLAGAMPAHALQLVLVFTAALAVAKAAGLLRFVVPRAALAPAGFGIGAMTGTAGGAGVLLAPVLLSAGLSGPAFVGTASAVAAVTHIGRVLAYRSSGLLAETRDFAASVVVLAAAIFAGNALAERVRPRLSPSAVVRIEYVTLIACVALSVAMAR